MPTCHILSEVGKALTSSRQDRLVRMQHVLRHAGFECKVYGDEICSPYSQEASGYEMEGSSNGFAEVLARLAPDVLRGAVKKGDLVIATEYWQHRAFPLLNATGGKFEQCPVVEMWIDYSLSFARFRIFSSNFASFRTCGYWKWEYFVSKPFYTPAKRNIFEKFFSVSPRADGYSLEHLEKTRAGIPVVAPKWGCWAESIEHGTTGLLYSCEDVRKEMEDLAAEFDAPDADIVQGWLAENYNLENAVSSVASYLSRVSHV